MARRRTATEGKAKQPSRQRADVHSGSHSSSRTSQTAGDGESDLAEGPIERAKEREARSPLSDEEFNSRVARKAFELYEHRGGIGNDMEDWPEAERLVREKLNEARRP